MAVILLWLTFGFRSRNNRDKDDGNTKPVDNFIANDNIRYVNYLKTPP